MKLRALPAFALAALAAAVPPGAHAAGLKLVAVVTAEGVHVPDEKPLRAYASRPWPHWDLAPGSLTPHGAQLATAFGAYYRARYAREGLVNASGCSVDAYAYASALPEARASAQALLDGFAPGCTLAVDGPPSGAPDPVFPPIPPPAASPELSPGDLRALNDLDTLLDCASTECRRVATPPRLDVAAAAAGALRAEYDDGLPGARVGWGHFDLTLLREFERLTVLRDRSDGRDPAAARAIASNLAAQLLETLRQAASGKRVQAARPPQRARFVAFIARPPYIEALATLLDASWTLPANQTGDIPPGGALVFELHEPDRRDGEPFVRAYFAAQPDAAMRRANASSVVPVSSVSVRLRGCPAADCPLPVFAAAAR